MTTEKEKWRELIELIERLVGEKRQAGGAVVVKAEDIEIDSEGRVIIKNEEVRRLVEALLKEQGAVGIVSPEELERAINLGCSVLNALC